jgi:hypothetical protein
MRAMQRTALALATAGLGLTACSHESTSPSSNGLTDQRAQEIGGRLARELNTSVNALAQGGRGGLAAASLRTAAGTASARADVVPCPAVSDLTDSDHDGIPDHATLVFALPQCEAVAGGDTTFVTGIVQIADPVYSPPPDPAAFGFAASFTGFTVRFAAADGDSSFVETRNGAEQVLFTPGGLAQSHAFAITHAALHDTAGIADEWNATFTPAAGSALVLNAPLPPGALAVVGATSWQSGTQGAHFELVTAVPLAYDPTCPANAPNRFRSGEIHAAMANSSGGTAIIRIVFADCQAAAIVLAHS